MTPPPPTRTPSRAHTHTHTHTHPHSHTACTIGTRRRAPILGGVAGGPRALGVDSLQESQPAALASTLSLPPRGCDPVVSRLPRSDAL